MNDLISRAELIEKYGDWYVEEGPEEGYIGSLKALISDMPVVDAAPVVHGRWETFKDVLGFSHYQCSECGDEWRRDDKNRQGSFTMRYCPECGAKMDGGDDDGGAAADGE